MYSAPIFWTSALDLRSPAQIARVGACAEIRSAQAEGFHDAVPLRAELDAVGPGARRGKKRQRGEREEARGKDHRGTAHGERRRLHQNIGEM
jgi:hypothetical protein